MNQYSLKESIFVLLLIVIFFSGCFFIFGYGIEFFENFENVGRAQLYALLILMILINIIYLLIYKNNFSKIQLLSNIVSYIILTVVFYIISIPHDEHMKTYTKQEFESIMVNNNFAITNYKNIGNLDIKDSEIIVAENNNIKFYYIISDSRSTASKIDKAIEDVEYGDCNAGGLYAISENRKSVVCQNPSYIRISYKIKNTIMIAESNNIEAEKHLNNLLNDLGYNKLDYER